MELRDYLEYLVKWIKEKTISTGAKGVIVGVSGGIDSAVVAMLAKKAFPDNYLTVWMPCESSKMDEDCANELFNAGDLKNVTFDLKPTFDIFKSTLKNIEDNENKLALANSKARLRMTSLYALAQSNNYLVLGTDNADEWHIGYFTKFGDGGCDLLPLVYMLKREVREAAKILGVPESIINRAPTASLWEDQTDESEIGYSYDQIDDYLIGKDVPNEVKQRVDYLNKISEHKRNHAAMPDEFKRD